MHQLRENASGRELREVPHFPARGQHATGMSCASAEQRSPVENESSSAQYPRNYKFKFIYSTVKVLNICLIQLS